MEEISERMRMVNTHCSSDEYTRLINSIDMCRYYVNPIDTAKKIHSEIDRYLGEINLDPIYYSIIEHVPLRNFQYVSDLEKLGDHYQFVTREEPREYEKHIAIALRFLELLREGTELGYILFPK